MNDEEPFYHNWRVLLLVFVILGSIAAITVSYSNGQFHIGNNLKYGLDLDGGSWLQVQLQGAIAQVDADPGKIVQVEFSKLLNDPDVKVNGVAAGSVSFTTSKATTQKTIDSFGFGTSTISSAPGGGTTVTLQTNKDFLIQKYLRDSLNAEVKQIPGSPGRPPTYEIRKAVTEDSLNAILEPVGGRVVPPFKVGVTVETRDETKKRLEDKLNPISFKQITITPIGDNYLLIDLPGVSIEEARKLALTPGKFEIRIQVSGNETAHVLYGDKIIGVGVPQKERRDSWGVSFELNDDGAKALRDAAIQYGAVTNPGAHYLSMYLDDKLVFDAPLDPDLAKNIQSVPVRSMVATTGAGDVGQEKAKELQLHLRAGALPVQVQEAGSGEVPAPLGQKFKEQVAIAGLIALVLVAIVVGLRYKQPNIIIPMLSTSFSEVIMILGFAVLLGLQLDLATIAGIIAVIGTGVDHLIIITDEVLAGGSLPPDKVYKSRISKAFAIIFAAAATVLVAMLPLILFMDSSALRGFAEITIAGVFIGVFIARPAYAVIIQGLLVEAVDKKYTDED
ncbi:preprotein translocase subunit SecD [Candidatus Methanoperedens nitratireducens]|uniref:Protein-export membrane protein SecD n=1 Tax=Candidatus Methanoperedens nitratireducens TaxID=1392998 RepID=A0A284VJG7_9EURY|nr:preprotein translocase subunit SecD [Candidatus Methanoperedens nitroreducens]SNQ59400.1 Protein-export membrane protein SecD [Candidatus Methanoperedens nitroreducens]